MYRIKRTKTAKGPPGDSPRAPAIHYATGVDAQGAITGLTASRDEGAVVDVATVARAEVFHARRENAGRLEFEPVGDSPAWASGKTGAARGPGPGDYAALMKELERLRRQHGDVAKSLQDSRDEYASLKRHMEDEAAIKASEVQMLTVQVSDLRAALAAAEDAATKPSPTAEPQTQPPSPPPATGKKK